MLPYCSLVIGEFEVGRKSETVQHQDWPELSEDALQREVTAREVELRVLRKELESRNEEVYHLENQLKDSETVSTSCGASCFNMFYYVLLAWQ